MRLKQIALIIICLWCASSVMGQKHHELKIDFPSLLNENIIPSYEIILSKHIGVEVALGFDLGNAIVRESQIITDGDIQRINFLSFKFSQTRFNPSISAKYYFSKTKIGKGFFLGPHLGFDILLNRDESYALKWEEVFPSIESDRIKSEGLKRNYYGLSYGYKWIFKSHYILELKGLLFADLPVGVGASEASRGFNSDLFINFGYRF